ncbi:hypothetical protein [Nocardia cyriacigeorgica]|uniref:hypothetical protein n=1 Tax=Nocardia cyriacigeorgica TaxID=135487 RepID=UPI002453FAF7|nr:hypothetical protein [Nocardia cyriacigeorgica]
MIQPGDPRYEHCHEAPVLLSEQHATGIVGIHTRIGCTEDTCARLRAARQYLTVQHPTPQQEI